MVFTCAKEWLPTPLGLCWSLWAGGCLRGGGVHAALGLHPQGRGTPGRGRGPEGGTRPGRAERVDLRLSQAKSALSIVGGAGQGSAGSEGWS